MYNEKIKKEFENESRKKKENINKFDKRKKEETNAWDFNDEEDDSHTSTNHSKQPIRDHETLKDKKLFEENVKKYDELFGKWLNTISNIQSNLQMYKNNERNVNSAQKELSIVFHQYARSVSKSSVLSKKKFFFTEEVTLENLDPTSKKEVIFGEQSEDFFMSSPPPGLIPMEFKNPTKPVKAKAQATINNPTENYNIPAVTSPGKVEELAMKDYNN